MPLGKELLAAISSSARERSAREATILQNSIDTYLDYVQGARGENIKQDEVDIEDFLSIFELQEKMDLFRMDATPVEGNAHTRHAFRSYMRYSIARTIHFAQVNVDDPDLQLYREFAQRLRPRDVVITFNYDTLLEDMLDELDIPYRFVLFVEPGATLLETILDTTEIVILKMHGSIDWFDRMYYEDYLDEVLDRNGISDSADSTTQEHPVFHTNRFEPRPLIEGKRYADDPLSNVYRIQNLGKYFTEDEPIPHDIPIIVSPSFYKLMHIGPLIELWRGIATANILSRKLVFVGYSLPRYDEYARLFLYYVSTLFQSSRQYGRNTILVDYRTKESEISDLRDSYCFLNWDKTHCYFDGFSMEAIKMIFDE